MCGIALAIALMAMDHRFEQLTKLRGGLSLLLSPVQYAVAWPSAGFRWLERALSSHAVLLEENRRLRAQLVELRGRSIKHAAVVAENKRLRELLDSAVQVQDRVVIAEILHVETDPLRRQIVINKGDRDRAFIGQTVIDTLGVVGQITHNGPYTSTVILITDPNHSIPVQVARNGVRAIATGTRQAFRLELPYLAASADVKKGDLLVASGLGGRFPHGYPVATISHIERNIGYTSAYATPAARLDRHREVLLVNQTVPTRGGPPADTDTQAAAAVDTNAGAESEIDTNPQADSATRRDPGPTHPEPTQ